MTNRMPVRRPVPKSSRATQKALDYLNSEHGHSEEEHFEEVNEKWLVSYADLMTLLFGFFVLMYSMSSVDQQKFAQAAQSANERFGTDESKTFGGKYQDPTELIDRQIAKELKGQPSLMKDVEITKGNLGLDINFRGKALFASSSAEISPLGVALIKKLAEQLKQLDVVYDVKVEGHTDDIPISTLRYPSNWELSASRAIWVVKLLKEEGIEAKRLEAVGYADSRPLVPNRSPAGQGIDQNQAMNRRVVIKLQRVFTKD